jgi:hypothetical protein
MTTSNIESAVSQAKVQISFSGVDIQSGGAGKINVGLANTSIN